LSLPCRLQLIIILNIIRLLNMSVCLRQRIEHLFVEMPPANFPERLPDDAVIVVDHPLPIPSGSLPGFPELSSVGKTQPHPIDSIACPELTRRNG
jgi:hypothetical protein